MKASYDGGRAERLHIRPPGPPHVLRFNVRATREAADRSVTESCRSKRIPPGDEDEDEGEEDLEVRQRKQEVLAVWWRISLLLRRNLPDVLCRWKLLKPGRANRKSDTGRTNVERDEVRNINDEHEDPEVDAKQGES